MAFASGRISSRQMLAAGGAISLIGVALLLAGHGEARQGDAKAGTMWRVSLAPWSSLMIRKAIA